MKGRNTKRQAPNNRKDDVNGQNSKGRTKGNRDYRRSKSQNRDHRNGREYDSKPEGMSPSNDISWYSKNPNLLLAAGSIPYPYRPGMQVPGAEFFEVTATTNLSSNPSVTVPGVCVLQWYPTLGHNMEPMDPASVTAKQIYSKIRSAFSGDLTVDPPDLMMYLMALDSVFSYIAFLKRVFRTINAYSSENYVTPDGLLRAMGFYPTNISDLRTNKMQLWQAINTLVLQSRKFTCPAIMDIFNRHYWMNDNVYLDAPMMNSQMYLFKQMGFYQFAELPTHDTPTANASGLVMKPLNISTNSSVVEQLYTFGNNLIQALVTWDEAYTINGYLLRAYEGVPTFVVEEITYDSILEPSYNEEVLTQIENAYAIPLSTNFTAGNMQVTQDVKTNSVFADLAYTVPAPTGSNKVQLGNASNYISLRPNQPTVADTVIATRLHCGITWNLLANNKLEITPVCGTEVVVGITLVRNPGGTWQEAVYNSCVIASGTNVPLGELNLESFDWHPIRYIMNDTGTTIVCAGDMHNITSITMETLGNIHRVCVYSEFGAFNQ